MKFICIIDASSYINLTRVELRFGTLLSMLAKEVTLRFSPEVNKEITRHRTEKMPPDIERSSLVHYLQRYGHNDYERRLFDKVTGRDKGEKLNFAVAVDCFWPKKEI